MGKKRTVGDFVESQYTNPNHKTGKGMGEGLLDLARHRTPHDLPGPLITAGGVITFLVGIGLLFVLLQGNFDVDILMPLVVFGALGIILVGTGLALRPPKKHKPKERAG